MSDDGQELSERDKAKIKGRDRKLRGPKVVMDNPGLRAVHHQLALRRRKPGVEPGKSSSQ